MANRTKSSNSAAKSTKAKGPSTVKSSKVRAAGSSKSTRPSKSAAKRSAKTATSRRSGRGSCRSADVRAGSFKDWRQECLARVRRIKFDKVADFCKKEVKELAALATRLHELAGHPPRRSTRKKKLTKEY